MGGNYTNSGSLRILPLPLINAEFYKELLFSLHFTPKGRKIRLRTSNYLKKQTIGDRIKKYKSQSFYKCDFPFHE